MAKVKSAGQLCQNCEEVLQRALLRALASPWANPDTTVREIGDRAWAWLEAERRCECAGRTEQDEHPGGIGDALYEKIWPIFQEAVRSGARPEMVLAVFDRVAREIRERLAFKL